MGADKFRFVETNVVSVLASQSLQASVNFVHREKGIDVDENDRLYY